MQHHVRLLTRKFYVWVVAVALLGFATLMFGWTKQRGAVDVTVELVQKPRLKPKEGQDTVLCENSCLTPSNQELEHFDGEDLLQTTKMLERLRRQRNAWMDNQLAKDYGEEHMKNLFMPLDKSDKRMSVGYKLIFKDPDLLAAPERAEGPGWDRMVRKYQMKVLQIQLGIIEERLDANNVCLEGCLNDAGGTRGSVSSKNQELGSRKRESRAEGLYAKFTWVTAGHSTSAGHGNFFRESYTSTMERALKPTLKQIGLDFQTRPYSMGGYEGGAELALCMNSIYGRDVDTVLWDFAQTDGRNANWKLILFAYRAAAISKIKDSLSQPGNVTHRPALIALNQRDENILVLQEMQKLGLTTLGFDAKYYKDVVNEVIPEMMGLTDDQIQQTPRFVRFFKCQGALEGGEPGCGDDKWNSTICPNRRYRVGWHPGWKYHALIGNLMAMTLLDLWEEAIEKLINLEPSQGGESVMERKQRLTRQLEKLDKEEENDYKSIFDSAVPDSLDIYIKNWQKDLGDLDVDSFLKEPSFCHAAHLPSEIRFRGFLTENFTSTGHILDQNSYDHGVPFREILRIETRKKGNGTAYNEADEMLLVEHDEDHQNCEENLNLDFKDFFLVSSRQGLRTLTVPNDSEMKHYTEFNPKHGKGLIVACLKMCDGGKKCPPNDFTHYLGSAGQKKKELLSETERAGIGELEITINGENVTSASSLHKCFALNNKDGCIWRPNAQGKYDIQVQITGATDYSFIRFSSFILL